jgi:threonine dehydrogenase-like Zn-dependent dehydrogenase
LRALRAAGPLLGRRVLITGASGGVGRFAVQLAARAGARVIASVGSPARGQGLAERGADEVVVGLDSLDQPVGVVLDSVGGPQLVAARRLLAPGQLAEHRLDIGGAGRLSPVFQCVFSGRRDECVGQMRASDCADVWPGVSPSRRRRYSPRESGVLEPTATKLSTKRSMAA